MKKMYIAPEVLTLTYQVEDGFQKSDKLKNKNKKKYNIEPESASVHPDDTPVAPDAHPW